MKKVYIVTGANGFLGNTIVKKLISQTAYSMNLKNYISDARISPLRRRALMSFFLNCI